MSTIVIYLIYIYIYIYIYKYIYIYIDIIHIIYIIYSCCNQHSISWRKFKVLTHGFRHIKDISVFERSVWRHLIYTNGLMGFLRSQADYTSQQIMNFVWECDAQFLYLWFQVTITADQNHIRTVLKIYYICTQNPRWACCFDTGSSPSFSWLGMNMNFTATTDHYSLCSIQRQIIPLVIACRTDKE